MHLKRSKKFFPLFILSFLVMICMISFESYAEDSISFSGRGTKESPYLITSVEELENLKDYVNEGKDFSGRYFYQTKDIDMKKTLWKTIIGEGADNKFSGIYDGGGHTLKNVNIISKKGHSALFGNLAGVIANLGIESGKIEGDTACAFALESVGNNAAILNCYNKAKISGNVVSGIAGTFVDNVIACSWNIGELSGESVWGIVSSGGDVKVHGCYAIQEALYPADVVGTVSYSIGINDFLTSSRVTKMNIDTAISQYMYAQQYGITLKQWYLNEKSQISYSDKENYLNIVKYINYYLLPAFLMILLIGIGIYCVKKGREKSKELYNRYKTGILVVSGCVSFFIDTAIWAKGRQVLNLGNIIFIFIINCIFVLCCITYLIKLHNYRITFQNIKNKIPLLIVISGTVFFEILQFKLVPVYDACFYYGSLQRGIEMFSIDLITYISSFVCWKWAQGLALLIAPFEFLMPGKMIGMYLSNLIISVVTVICLYWLIKKIFPKLPSYIIAAACGIFIFSPYAIGMFTYLCMDWHLAFFAVWLLCGIYKKDNLLIAFSGYLLSFTKITGFVFYVFVLLAYGLFEIYKFEAKNMWKKIIYWWQWDKVILWIFPALLFLATFLFGHHMTAQNFYGTYVSEQMVLLGNWVHVGNVFLQTFVLGFRWILVLGAIFTFALNLIKKKKQRIVKSDRDLLYSINIGFISVFVLICLYNSDADCPRYTAIFNLYFVFLFLYIINARVGRILEQKIMATIMFLLFFIQTFVTIDPTILALSDTIDTGKRVLHKLALPMDSRIGMNLGTGYGEGNEVMGDLYSYNFEFIYYNSLVDDLMRKVKPTKKDQFYVLDIIDYELHLAGSANRNYKIYWDPSLKRRTYDKNNEKAIYLNERSITTEELSQKEVKLPESFYLIVVDRIKEERAVKALEKSGYSLERCFKAENSYGKMSAIKFLKE